MNNSKKVFVSCGEMSGDMHLSYIIEEMLKIDPNLEFFGVVGDKSIAAGVKKINHIKDNDIMGFLEAIKKYGYFKEKAEEYLKYIRDNNIGTVIFVDFGGFNLRFFKLVKERLPKVRTIYYIPPKVWAWGKKRIYRLAEFDDVIVIFPFEKEYFDKKRAETGLDVRYFGNPLTDKYTFSEEFGEKILLLPGSRKQEIRKFIPEIVKFLESEEMKDEKFIIKFADESHLNYVENIDLSKIENLEVSFDNIKSLREKCKLAIATSGTVTFEMALMGLPVIVVYKTSSLNAFIARKILNLKYVSLTNINAGEEIFPELLQEDFSKEKLILEYEKIKNNIDMVMLKLKDERKKMGDKGVLEKVAGYLVNRINENNMIKE